VIADRIKGTVIGALMGDASGAYLEFIGRQPTEEEVDEAMALGGGGFFELAPGQYTDDGEMTAALLDTLDKNRGVYDVHQVARAYRLWLLSLPFDIGNATRIALSGGKVHAPNIGDQMTQCAEIKNIDSKANGCMMRATPLGVVAARMTPDETILMVEKDVRLTHPNPTCVDATTAYVLAIRHLILHVQDHQGAVELVADYLAGTNAEVEAWLQDAITGNLPLAYPLAGFVRYAFTYAMHYLFKGTDYRTAIRETLLRGGDTDTNACIVGGLLGAFHGLDQLPKDMYRLLMRCKTHKGNQARPDLYTIKRVKGNLDQLSAYSKLKAM
jgi:ADP-ribosylglycohydrolase